MIASLLCQNLTTHESKAHAHPVEKGSPSILLSGRIEFDMCQPKIAPLKFTNKLHEGLGRGRSLRSRPI